MVASTRVLGSGKVQSRPFKSSIAGVEALPSLGTAGRSWSDTDRTERSDLNSNWLLAAAIAHELNQPLTAAATYAAALEELLQDVHGEAAVLAGKLARQVAKAGEMIRSMRLLAGGKVEGGTENLCAIVDEVLWTAASDPSARDVQIGCDLPPEVLVSANRVQIQQVLSNLLRNALEAVNHDGGREITVTVRLAGPKALTCVADTGVGIPAHLAKRLFAPVASDKPGGMGVGLAIAKAIVEAHGGEIWCESGEGGGTAFKFTLPLAPDA